MQTGGTLPCYVAIPVRIGLATSPKFPVRWRRQLRPRRRVRPRVPSPLFELSERCFRCRMQRDIRRPASHLTSSNVAGKLLGRTAPDSAPSNDDSCGFSKVSRFRSRYNGGVGCGFAPTRASKRIAVASIQARSFPDRQLPASPTRKQPATYQSQPSVAADEDASVHRSRLYARLQAGTIGYWMLKGKYLALIMS